MKTKSSHTGFTLVEVIVALSVFLIVMTISMGSILGIFDANRKGESQKTVTNGLNFAMETMSREMRYGKGYVCNNTGSSNCPTSSTDSITFTSTLTGTSEVIRYYLSSGAIIRDASGNQIPLTGTDVNVTTLQFYVEGNNAPPPATSFTTQPRVRIRVVADAGTNTRSQSSFVLQAVVSQRDLNN
jgi:prepilin-type N-terminal cleavage/methylation domain-containing protein